MAANDRSLEYLLELNGVRYVIDDRLGLWVKFDVKRVSKHLRQQGIRYSLSLHDRHNHRILSFDNAHEIEYGGKTNVSPKKMFDHWHVNLEDIGRPYRYKNAGKLLEDFWKAVNKKINEIQHE